MFVNYGIDAFRIQPAMSALFSVIMILGQYSLGDKIIKTMPTGIFPDSLANSQANIIGALVLAIVLYPVALYIPVSNYILFITAIILMLSGAWRLIAWMRHYTARPFQILNSWPDSRGWVRMDSLLLLGYLMLAILPVTNADSLDYHVGVALKLLNEGSIMPSPEWLAGRIAGNGEILNALGFAVGAEQYGSLLQFTAVFSIYGLINHKKEQDKYHSRWRYFLGILFLAAPVLVFLVYSLKPQLLGIAMTSLAFYLLFFKLGYKDSNHKLSVFVLIATLCMAASQLKFSFMLSGGLLGIVSLSLLIHQGKILKPVVIASLLFGLIIFPIVLWKSQAYGGSFLASFLTPIPGNWPGTEAFEQMLRAYRDGNISFPISLVVPQGAGGVTTIVGIGVFSIVFVRIREGATTYLAFACIGIVFILSFLLGPTTSRSYMEPYIWMLIMLSAQRPPEIYKSISPIYSKLIVLQAMVVAGLCVYGFSAAMKGLIHDEGRKSVMLRLANGYTLVDWLDQELPRNAVILSEHRSLALWPRKSVSLDWSRFTTHKNPEVLPYINRIKTERVSHLLVMGSINDSSVAKAFENCFKGEAIGPGPGMLATRNPFNTGENFDVWLIEIDYQRFPGCYFARQ